jgi:chromate transporter
MHIPHFIRKLVDDKNFCDKKTLLDINSFCSILPGPSTTQTITALGFKLGGPRLAFQALLAWVLPGAIIMAILTVSPKFLANHHLRFMQPMVAAFLCYAVYSMGKLITKGALNYTLFLLAGILSFYYHSPLIFPIGIIAGGVLSANFGNRPFSPNHKPFGKVKLANLTIYISIFLAVGLLGVALTQNQRLLGIGQPFVLFENCFRMGSLAFGGGNTLAAMAVEQYVYHKPRMTIDELNIGLGLVQGLPGPNFNLGVYLNGIAMKNLNYGLDGQILGCFLGMAGIFLPGTLLIFFAYPLWDRLQTYPIVQRSLDGIFATSTGFILGAAFIFNHYFWSKHLVIEFHWTYILVFGLTLGSLFLGKIPSPLIVIGTILAGVLLPL